MAINFPNSPALNELYSESGYTWKWSGTSWTNVTSTAGTPGAQGIQGIQGTQGTSVQGVQGPAGSSQGTQGSLGAQGTQGLQGAGSQGVQGLAGSAQGTQGTQGRQGTQGAGSQGAQGLAGTAQGTQGTQGIQGLQGAGSQGAQGLAGTAQGTQGAAGSGGGSPPGSDTQVVYNNAGAFGAASTVNYFSGNTTLLSTGNVRFTGNVVATPSLSISTNLTYADNAAGKVIVVDTSGGDKIVTFAPASVSGFAITVVRKGSGNLTIAASGITKYNSASYISGNVSSSNSGATVVYTATNEIYLIGDIESSTATVQGAQGAQGPGGGAQGAQGPAGSSQGTQGTQGLQGLQGTSVQGAQGAAGGGGGGSISVTDETVSSSTYYPSLSTVTTGTLTTVNVSSTKLTFTPSTGTLNATAFNSLSDRRAKTNIESLPYGLTDVLNLEPKKFQMKDTGLFSIGLIAQEVENIIPEVVHLADGYKGINYSVLVAVLINAIKELNSEIQELKQK